VVKAGDTLSKIAKKVYGHKNRWPTIWWTNHKKVHNPNRLRIGERLTLESQANNDPQLMTKAMRHIPVVHVHYAARRSSIVGDGASSPAPVAAVSYSGSSGFQACVIQRESGGNPLAQNPTSTASGLYGFLDTTWTAVTGLPGPARAYSIAQQNAAFEKEYAQAGTSPWAAYDGC
jgi:hypothetical protein